MTMEKSLTENEKPSKRPFDWRFWIAVGCLIILAAILLHGPCDPAPEPIPAASSETTGIAGPADIRDSSGT